MNAYDVVLNSVDTALLSLALSVVRSRSDSKDTRLLEGPSGDVLDESTVARGDLAVDRRRGWDPEVSRRRTDEG